MQLKTSRLTYVSAFLALIIALPILALVMTSFTEAGQSFQHIRETVLSDYVVNTLTLMTVVGLLVTLIGVPVAWLVACCEFSGKHLFNWALVLPLAMPGYLIAYTYTDLFDYAGPIQTTLRTWFDWSSPDDYWFFDIRSLGGAACMLALVLFPYVYLMAKANFLNQNASLTLAARTLGYSPLRSFFSVSLPIAKNSIVAAVSLVLMETLADFATVHYFAVNTLTTAVYDTWLGYYDLASAAKLSVLMIVGVFALIVLEHKTNKRGKDSNSAKMSIQPLTYQLKGSKNILAVLFCSLVFIAGFAVPAFVLLNYSIDYYKEVWSLEVLQYAWNSAYIAIVVSILSVIIALVLNVNLRSNKTNLSKNSLNIASLGYAVPGTVLAIAVLIPLSGLDHTINDIAGAFGWTTPGLILSGTVVAIIFTHIVRFLAIANNSIRTSFQQLNVSYDWAAKSLGSKQSRLFRQIHWPLLKRSAFVAGLLIFVESMKELPAALLLRPFNFDTLPTYVFQYASDEQLEQAALGAILIVIVGLIPLIFINRSIEHSQS
ncbi:ABC transporter permease [Psychrosphaera aestuarii]|uniref:ABC transporter permease n=1 Tax=Psychrosphaera aestuarii TaxID=1266052 RepID=UPI001B33521D|nr:iron ABC transporter permease [Psychrosphaera aestuarii]